MDQTGRKFSEHFSKFIATHEEHETTLTKLHIIHSSYLKLNRRYQEEVLQLQNRYLLQYKALFTKRQKILKPDSHNAPNGKDIPDFWLVAMKNSSIVAGSISAADEEVLRCLRDVRVEGLGKTQGFKLVFQFDKNTFFSNESLTKTFTYEYEDNYKGEFRNGSAIGCTIEWKDGKNLTTLSDVEDDGNETESFFAFFDTPGNKRNTDQKEDVDETPAERQDTGNLSDEFDDDSHDDGDIMDFEVDSYFEIGEEIKDSLVPYALYWYTGEAKLDEYDVEFEDNEDIEDWDVSDGEGNEDSDGRDVGDSDGGDQD